MNESKLKAAGLKFAKKVASSNPNPSSVDTFYNLNRQRKPIPISVPKEGDHDEDDDHNHSRLRRDLDQICPASGLPTRPNRNMSTKRFPVPPSGYSTGSSTVTLEDNPMGVGSSSFPSSRLLKPAINHNARSQGSRVPGNRTWTPSNQTVEQSPPNSSTPGSHFSSRLGSEHFPSNDGRSTVISSPHQEKPDTDTCAWAAEDQSLILRLDAATASPTRPKSPVRRTETDDLYFTQRITAAIASPGILSPPRETIIVQKPTNKKKPSIFLNSSNKPGPQASSSKGLINPIRKKQTLKPNKPCPISPQNEVSMVTIPELHGLPPLSRALNSRATSLTGKQSEAATSIFLMKNEFDRFPEVRSKCQSPDQSFDYSLDTPDIDPNSICPFCDEPLPKKPSKKLTDLIQHLIKRPHAEKRPTPQNPQGISLPFFETASCCKMHSDERDLIPYGISQGWPTDIDFSKLPKRIKSYRSVLNQIIKREKKSRFLDQAMETWSVQGAVRIRNVVNEFENFEVEQPGYYGYRGHELIYNTLSRLFRLEEADIEPLSPDYLIRRVLLPEVSLRLIADDLGLPYDDEKVINTLEESRSFGSALFPMGESYLESESESGDDIPIERRTRSPPKKVNSKLIKNRISNSRHDENSDVEIVIEKKENKNKGKGSQKKAWEEDDVDQPKRLTEKNHEVCNEKTRSKGKAKADDEVRRDKKDNTRVNGLKQTQESSIIDDQVLSSSSDDEEIQIERPKFLGSKKENQIVYLDGDKDESLDKGFSKSVRSKTKIDKYSNEKGAERDSSVDKKRKKIQGDHELLKKKRKVLPDSSEDELDVIKKSNSSAPGSSQQPSDEQVCLKGSNNFTLQKKKKMQPINEIASKDKKKAVNVDVDDDDETDYEQNRSLEALSLHCSQKQQNINKPFEIIEVKKDEKENKEKKKTPAEILRSCKIKKIDKPPPPREPSIEQVIEKKYDPIVQGKDYRKNLNQTSIRSISASGSKGVLPVAHPTRPYTNPASTLNRYKKSSSNRSVRTLSTKDDPGWLTQI